MIGPRFLQIVQMAVLALLDEGAPRPASLADMERLIRDGSFLKEVIEWVQDPDVAAFWRQYDAQSTTPFHQAEVLMYVTSKFTPLIQGTLRHALSEPASYRFEDVISEGGILICRIPVGELGFRATNFLGRLTLARLLDALAAQFRTVERPPEVSLVVDEIQVLAGGETVERFLSQSRKFGASASYLNQAPSALGLDTLRSLLTNVANVVLFRVSRSEAELFSDRLGEAAERLPRLPDHYAVARTKSGARPFVLQGLPPLEVDREAAADTLTRSRGRFGRRPRALSGGRDSERRGPKPPEKVLDSNVRKRLREADQMSSRGSVRRRSSAPRGRNRASRGTSQVRVWCERHVWGRSTPRGMFVGVGEGLAEILNTVEPVVVPSGSRVAKGEPLALLDTALGVAVVAAPVDALVSGMNPFLEHDPDLLKREPYGAGWLAIVRPAPSVGDDLSLEELDAYRRFLSRMAGSEELYAAVL